MEVICVVFFIKYYLMEMCNKSLVFVKIMQNNTNFL